MFLLRQKPEDDQRLLGMTGLSAGGGATITTT
jgi:hypothetical protein